MMAAIERHCKAAIVAIAASPRVRKFKVGLTSQSLAKRGAQYRGVKYRSVVLLADRLTWQEAIDLERCLFKQSKGIAKWCGEKHLASTGGVKKRGRCYGVYVAWTGKHANSKV